MLRRIYIDNYKCCVNLEVEFDTINLFLGDNGAGKSTVFEVLRKLQGLVSRGREVQEMFPLTDLTRWQSGSHQRFELELEGNGGLYKYQLLIDHDRERELARINKEKLWFEKEPLLDFEHGEAQLYRDNHSEGPKYPFDWSRSAVGALPPRHDNTRLTWFRERLSKLIVVRINPFQMDSESRQEAEFLDDQCKNFVSWYRQVSQNQGKAFEIAGALQGVIDGFKYFEFEKVGENQRQLRVQIQDVSYRLDELSDGQRALIVLYSLIYFARGEDVTLCIDEPGNFIALPEVQPWLLELYDFCIDSSIQSLLISHHPELINYLAKSVGVLFTRDSNSPVRVAPIQSNGALPTSELVARGWVNE